MPNHRVSAKIPQPTRHDPIFISSLFLIAMVACYSIFYTYAIDPTLIAFLDIASISNLLPLSISLLILYYLFSLAVILFFNRVYALCLLTTRRLRIARYGYQASRLHHLLFLLAIFFASLAVYQFLDRFDTLLGIKYLDYIHLFIISSLVMICSVSNFKLLKSYDKAAGVLRALFFIPTGLYTRIFFLLFILAGVSMLGFGRGSYVNSQTYFALSHVTMPHMPDKHYAHVLENRFGYFVLNKDLELNFFSGGNSHFRILDRSKSN